MVSFPLNPVHPILRKKNEHLPGRVRSNLNREISGSTCPVVSLSTNSSVGVIV